MDHQSQVKLSSLFRQNQVKSGYDLHEIKQRWLEYKTRQQNTENHPFLIDAPYASQLDELI
jgi:hypothetical protein|uniref:hypothetical protein n=1 Tax=Polynucleobacter sp. TaxID=2029855 RepID=UPI0040477E3A